jgi:hypothetical protein
MTTTMSKDSAIEQLQRMGVPYIGREEWTRIVNAAETPTRRPTSVMESVGHEVPPQAGLSDEQHHRLFPPTPDRARAAVPQRQDHQ